MIVARMAALGMAGIGAVFLLFCQDHSGAGQGIVQQWNAVDQNGCRWLILYLRTALLLAPIQVVVAVRLDLDKVAAVAMRDSPDITEFYLGFPDGRRKFFDMYAVTGDASGGLPDDV